MKPYWFGAVAMVVVLLFVGLGYADKTRLHWVAEDSTAAPPDRVVGVELKCDWYRTGDGNLEFGTLTGWNAPCGPNSATIRYWNTRKELTIRTVTGQTYRVAYGAEHDVQVGDEWPPK